MNSAYTHFSPNLAEYSLFFRSISNEIEKNSDSIFNYSQHPAIKALREDRHLTLRERVKLYEALSYGDINVLFSAARSCLSGFTINEIGSPEQQDYYFNYVAKNNTRTFFCTTEPNYGSDTSKIETFIEQDSLNDDVIYLTGEKMLVGNCAAASIGVVVARQSSGLASICTILITPEDLNLNKDKVVRKSLPTFGIESAQLGFIQFNKFKLNKKNILGTHLSPTKRGLLAIMNSIYKMRICIAALAAGHAQSVIDYILENKNNISIREKSLLNKFQIEIFTVREFINKAVNKFEDNPSSSELISLAKVTASELAEKICRKSFDFFGLNGYLEHPFLVKRYQNSFGFEYLDGTSDIQRKNIFQGLKQDDFITN